MGGRERGREGGLTVGRFVGREEEQQMSLIPSGAPFKRRR
jgi:hypothetical protein